MLYEDEIVGSGAAGVRAAEERARRPVPRAGSAPHTGQMTYAEETPHVVTRNALLLMRDIAIAFAVIILVLQFVKPTIVFEHSMENTLHPEDYVFLAKQAYRFGDVAYGDIVVFESSLLDERGQAKNLIKRVIGLPGDVIEVRDGTTWRNGERLIEPYTFDGTTLGEMAAVTVPEGSYFVMGDNRQVSKDSRSAGVGFVLKGSLKGKVVFRLLPLSTAGNVYENMGDGDGIQLVVQ